MGVVSTHTHTACLVALISAVEVSGLRRPDLHDLSNGAVPLELDDDDIENVEL